MDPNQQQNTFNYPNQHRIGQISNQSIQNMQQMPYQSVNTQVIKFFQDNPQYASYFQITGNQMFMPHTQYSMNQPPNISYQQSPYSYVHPQIHMPQSVYNTSESQISQIETFQKPDKPIKVPKPEKVDNSDPNRKRRTTRRTAVLEPSPIIDQKPKIKQTEPVLRIKPVDLSLKVYETDISSDDTDWNI